VPVRAFPYQQKGEPLQTLVPTVDRFYVHPPGPTPGRALPVADVATCLNYAPPLIPAPMVDRYEGQLTQVPVTRLKATPAYYPFEGLIRQPWVPIPTVDRWFAHSPGPTVRPLPTPWVWQYDTAPLYKWLPAVTILDPSSQAWWLAPPGPTARAAATPQYYLTEGQIRYPWLPAPTVDLWIDRMADPTVRPTSTPWRYPNTDYLVAPWVPAPAVDRWQGELLPGPTPARRATPQAYQFSTEPDYNWTTVIPTLNPATQAWWLPPPEPVVRAKATPQLYQDRGAPPTYLPMPTLDRWHAYPPGPTLRPAAKPWSWQYQTDISRTWWTVVVLNPALADWWVPPPGPVTRPVATPHAYPRDAQCPLPKATWILGNNSDPSTYSAAFLASPATTVFGPFVCPYGGILTGIYAYLGTDFTPGVSIEAAIYMDNGSLTGPGASNSLVAYSAPVVGTGVPQWYTFAPLSTSSVVGGTLSISGQAYWIALRSTATLVNGVYVQHGGTTWVKYWQSDALFGDNPPFDGGADILTTQYAGFQAAIYASVLVTAPAPFVMLVDQWLSTPPGPVGRPAATPQYYQSEGTIRTPWLPIPAVSSWQGDLLPGPVTRPQAMPQLYQDRGAPPAWLPVPIVVSMTSPQPGPIVRPKAQPQYDLAEVFDYGWNIVATTSHGRRRRMLT